MCNTTICYIKNCSEPASQVSRCNARATVKGTRSADPCYGWETRVKPQKVSMKFCAYHNRDYLDKKGRESELLERTASSRRRHEKRGNLYPCERMTYDSRLLKSPAWTMSSRVCADPAFKLEDPTPHITSKPDIATQVNTTIGTDALIKPCWTVSCTPQSWSSLTRRRRLLLRS